MPMALTIFLTDIYIFCVGASGGLVPFLVLGCFLLTAVVVRRKRSKKETPQEEPIYEEPTKPAEDMQLETNICYKNIGQIRLHECQAYKELATYDDQSDSSIGRNL